MYTPKIELIFFCFAKKYFLFYKTIAIFFLIVG